MSGTSLDGIDAALVEIVPDGSGYGLSTRAALTAPFEPALSERLRCAVAPGTPSPREVTELDALLGASLGEAAARVADGVRIDFVASHGLTLYHNGYAPNTLQIGDPYRIRERTGATVTFDFRRADCAAGGHGAPLVPYVDALLFASPQIARAALNLGGIANVTILPRGSGASDAVAWDIGPGNMVLDAFVRTKTGGREGFDRDGAYAARGAIDAAALEVLRRDPYFERPAPKSTGREEFGDGFMQAHAALFDRLSLENGCAMLVALTADAVAAAIAEYVRKGEVIVSGGGAENPAMLQALRERLPQCAVTSSLRFGIDPAFKEALAFAVLGYELLRGRPAGMPRVTGASHAALLGAIAPAGLDALLPRLHEEVAAAK